MNTHGRAFREWQQADADARLAENEVTDQWNRYYRREGPAPSADLLAEMSRRRTVANTKLQAAIRSGDRPASH